MICSSVNLDRFIRPSLRWAGLYVRLAKFQGVTSAGGPTGRSFSCVAPAIGRLLLAKLSPSGLFLDIRRGVGAEFGKASTLFRFGR